MPQDLRSYMDQVKTERPDDFVSISKEVDPAFEITATIVKMEQVAKRRPVVVF